ncbi:FkbM family methyltransferase [Hasllibacter sp. MH4015]|uniref:FkbM family methyltransferase n=1 Tax=Hasllibacter sp. MH4015 TaxID=2854029 RepID=UPI001CD2874B|nr:FkbM family methyltransferase [Hasllibacter sp. MH4015]
MVNQAEFDALQQDYTAFQRRHWRRLKKQYARGVMDGILALLRPGDIVLDCGANVGAVAEPLARTGATVLCFEPDPYAFARLTDRLGDHPNVTLHHAAVGVTAGTARLMRAANFDDNPGNASVKSTLIPGGFNIDEETGIDVPVLSLPDILDDLIDTHGQIAFLKLDIEGAELDLLEHLHARSLFDHIRLTVAETHEKKFPALRPRFAALRGTLSAAYPPTRVNLDWI